MVSSFLVAAFYALEALSEERRSHLGEFLEGRKDGLLGSVLLAPDGLNATLAGPEDKLESLLNDLSQMVSLSTIKRSRCDKPPFRKFEVQRRRETVTSGVIGKADSQEAQGTHLTPRPWQEALKDNPQALVLDVRNH